MSDQTQFKFTSEQVVLYGGKKGDPLRGQWLPAPERRIKVLNLSGGKQSSLLELRFWLLHGIDR